MVRGLDVFTQWFKEFSDQYVLIGGTAASLAMKEFGVPFRGTKDLDVVLHLEALTPEFGEIFWKFIDAGGYEVKQRDYYDFVMSGRKTQEGLTWIAEDRLIPLKALAWLNLTRSQEAGAPIRPGDIRKHLDDVVNLSNLLSPQLRIGLGYRISADLQEFIAKVNVDAYPDFAQVKGRLVLAYGLE